jgi:hypothetical protein
MVITGQCELMVDKESYDANKRLKLILEASAYMTQLINNYQRREEERPVQPVFVV